MKAFAYYQAESAPVLITRDTPTATGRDLLIEIDAIAVNPVDTKVISAIQDTLEHPKITGYDVAGRVIATGDDCQLFKVGDRVYYAGTPSRDGCYATHQLVDEQIVGMAPTTLSANDAAAMPLTSITAWESLFSRMKIHPEIDKGKTLLIVGAAGGVGSIAIQLAKHVAELNVVATASREESISWCRELGADFVINHHQLLAEYAQLNIAAPDYILCLNDTDSYFDSLAELVAPQGLICYLVTSQQQHNIDSLKTKSAGIVWEFMFTRPMFNTTDMIAQHHILNRIAIMLDTGQLRSTLKLNLGNMSVDTITQAHDLVKSGQTIGKITLAAMSS